MDEPEIGEDELDERMKYEMIGCDIIPHWKVVAVYPDSYINDEWRKKYEDAGYRIVKGERYGPRKPMPPPKNPKGGE